METSQMVGLMLAMTAMKESTFEQISCFFKDIDRQVRSDVLGLLEGSLRYLY